MVVVTDMQERVAGGRGGRRRNSVCPGYPPAVTLSVRLPPGLPDGLTEMLIPVKYGKNVNF